MKTNKDYSKEIRQVLLSKKNGHRYKYTTSLDIERLLNHYGKVMSKIIEKGGYITLQPHNNDNEHNIIRVVPKHREVIGAIFDRRIARRKYFKLRRDFRAGFAYQFAFPQQEKKVHNDLFHVSPQEELK
jgi:hypothetical protein